MLRIIILVVLVYAGFGAYVFFLKRNFIYYPNYPTQNDFYNCSAFAGAEKIDVGGTRAYYSHTSEKMAIVYHGNAGSACDRGHLREIFERAGYSYLFVEYAGYAGEEGEPSRSLLLKDADNVISFLKNKNYREIALFAESLGTGVASYHARLLPPDKMIFVSPFDNLANVAKSHFPLSLYPVSIMLEFSGENYENTSYLSGYKKKLVIIHGTEDNLIPIKLGKELFGKISTLDKKFVAVDGAGHNDIYNFDKTLKEISDLLRE